MLTLRRLVFWLHLLAGTVAGSVILVMSATGALLAFEPQLVDFAERRGRTVVPPEASATRLDMDAVLAAARRVIPDASPTFLTTRATRTTAVRVDFGRDTSVFVDPYTGEVTGRGSRVRAALHMVEDWHRWLGSREVGRPITGVCNATFFILCATGVYLWWPRKWNRHALRGVAWFTPRLSGRARDWSWHNVTGSWCAPALVVLTFTGLVMSYQWANDLLYTLTGSTAPPAPVVATERTSRGSSAPDADRRPIGVGALWARAEQQAPEWISITLRLPPRPGAPATAFIQEPGAWHPTPRSILTMDPLTGRVLGWEPYSGINLGRTLRFWARPLHTGTVAGPAGQLVAALASAGGVVLVWTGVSLAYLRFWAWTHRRPTTAAAAPVVGPVHQPLTKGDGT